MSSQSSLPLALTLCKDETARLLVVEGKDDCNGIYQIAARHNLQGTFGIWEAGSDERALERFGGLLLSSKNRPEVMGIVLDCDADESGMIRRPERRWAQVKQRLEKCDYLVPKDPNPTGTIVEGPLGFPKVGVWLMPDNQTEGMFEDFLLPLISPAARTFAEASATSARDQNFGNFKQVHLSKAVAHTFLAWQDEPGRPLGLAIKARMFDLKHPKAEPFVGWLRDLFS